MSIELASRPAEAIASARALCSSTQVSASTPTAPSLKALFQQATKSSLVRESTVPSASSSNRSSVAGGPPPPPSLAPSHSTTTETGSSSASSSSSSSSSRPGVPLLGPVISVPINTARQEITPLTPVPEDDESLHSPLPINAGGLHAPGMYAIQVQAPMMATHMSSLDASKSIVVTSQEEPASAPPHAAASRITDAEGGRDSFESPVVRRRTRTPSTSSMGVPIAAMSSPFQSPCASPVATASPRRSILPASSAPATDSPILLRRSLQAAMAASVHRSPTIPRSTINHTSPTSTSVEDFSQSSPLPPSDPALVSSMSGITDEALRAPHPFVAPLLTACPPHLVMAAVAPSKFKDPFQIAATVGLTSQVVADMITAARLARNHSTVSKAFTAIFASSSLLATSFNLPLSASTGAALSSAPSLATSTSSPPIHPSSHTRLSHAAMLPDVIAQREGRQRSSSDPPTLSLSNKPSASSIRRSSVPPPPTASTLNGQGSRPGQPLSLSSTEFCGIDYTDLMAAYSLILSHAMPREVASGMAAGMESLLSRLEHTSLQSETSVTFLHQLFIIWSCPLVTLHSNAKPLLRKLLLIHAALSPALSSVLVRWITHTWPKETRKRMTETVLTFLADQVKPNDIIPEPAHAAAVFLTGLHDANESTGLVKSEQLKTEDFNSEYLSLTVPWKEEYRYWRDRQALSAVIEDSATSTPALSTYAQPSQESSAAAAGVSVGSHGTGGRLRQGPSWIDFPVLMDPTCLARLIRIDSMLQMSQFFEEALVHSSWMVEASELLKNKNKAHPAYSQATVAITNPYCVLKVRRSHLVSDTLVQLSRSVGSLKKPLKIVFEGEEGLDQGGVQKEFFLTLFKELFSSSFGLFAQTETNNGVYWFTSSTSFDSGEGSRLAEYRAIGLILALSIYNGVIANIGFPSVFFAKLLNPRYKPTMSDLKESFPDVASSMESILAYEGDDLEDVFGLTWSVTVPRIGSSHQEIELVPGGADLPVTSTNVKEYIDAHLAYLLDHSIAPAMDALADGFSTVMGTALMSLFRPNDLELLLCGSSELDVSSLRAIAEYIEFEHDDPVIHKFWNILDGMTAEEQRAVLFFVTGSDRVPIDGASKLQFVIQRNGPDTHRLPTASTCFNRLLLPAYDVSDGGEKMKRMMKLAIVHGQGFGLI